MSKSVGNIAPLHEVLDSHGRDAVILYFVGAHYRQPIAFDESRRWRRPRSVQRIREARRGGSVAGDSRPSCRAAARRFFAALADDFNTPSALAAMWDWIREANRRDDPVGDRDLREMLGVLGLENLLELPGRPARGASRWPSARAIARAEDDFATRRRAARADRGAGLVGARHADGFELQPVGVIVYGRNAVREALRGARVDGRRDPRPARRSRANPGWAAAR